MLYYSLLSTLRCARAVPAVRRELGERRRRKRGETCELRICTAFAILLTCDTLMTSSPSWPVYPAALHSTRRERRTQGNVSCAFLASSSPSPSSSNTIGTSLSLGIISSSPSKVTCPRVTVSARGREARKERVGETNLFLPLGGAESAVQRFHCQESTVFCYFGGHGSEKRARDTRVCCVLSNTVPYGHSILPLVGLREP